MMSSSGPASSPFPGRAVSRAWSRAFRARSAAETSNSARAMRLRRLSRSKKTASQQGPPVVFGQQMAEEQPHHHVMAQVRPGNGALEPILEEVTAGVGGGVQALVRLGLLDDILMLDELPGLQFPQLRIDLRPRRIPPGGQRPVEMVPDLVPSHGPYAQQAEQRGLEIGEPVPEFGHALSPLHHQPSRPEYQAPYPTPGHRGARGLGPPG